MKIAQFKRLNIGICGCGYWASNIIKSLEEEKFNSVYAFDFDKKKLKNINKKATTLLQILYAPLLLQENYLMQIILFG